MDNIWTVAEQKIKSEIYGLSILITPDIEKKATLMNNLHEYALHTPNISSTWIDSMEPYVDKLCALDNIKIVPFPAFLIFELQTDPTGKIQIYSHAKVANPVMVASFDGFIDKIKKDADYHGTPKYHYIYNMMEGQNPSGSGSSKIIRYASYVTPHKIIDGSSSLKKKTS
jgi:hypothetical protein